MQNRFSLKDFFLFVLVGVVGLMVFLSMKQADRGWKEMQSTQQDQQELQDRLVRLQRTVERDLQNQLEAIERRLEEGVVAVAGDGRGREAGPAVPPWAREGYEVHRSEPWSFNTDPYEQENFTTGGEFREVFEGQPPRVTPYLYADVYGRTVVELVAEPLGNWDAENLHMRGVLAEAWQYDPDGMWLRVRIRDRARFSDGEPVTAEDVRFTYEEIIHNPEIEADRFRGVYTAVEHIEVIDDKTVEFTFYEPRFDNLVQAMGFVILPKHMYEDWIESPSMFNQSTALLVGSGPFRFRRVSEDNQWSPPDDIVIIRNENYWADVPPVSRIRFQSISNSLARLTTFDNEETDLIRPLPEQYAHRHERPDFIEKHHALNWYNIRGGYSFIAWQCGERDGRPTPFSDVRVRKAMTHLIDRERIIRDIYRNIGRLASGPFNSVTPQANPDIEPWPYDLDRARELLHEAGWRDRRGDGVLRNERGDPFVFELTFGEGNESTLQMVTYVRDQCARLGIQCELRPIDWSILSSTLNRRDFDAITFGWSPSSPESDPYQIWHSDQIEGQGDNFIQWRNEEADHLIEKGRITLDDQERMKIWHELHRVMHEDQPYTFLTERPWLRFLNGRIKNFNEYATGFRHDELFIPSGMQMTD